MHWNKVNLKLFNSSTHLKHIQVYLDPKINFFAIKEVVLPFNKFPGTDILLGPEMRSTGEVMGIDKSFAKAYLKSQIAAGIKLPKKGTAFISVKGKDKNKKLLEICKIVDNLGIKIVATSGTAEFLLKNNIKVLDGCVIGKKGFGFFPVNGNNLRFPQIGIVLIDDNTEIGCGSTMVRGSLSNTIIGKNTYLDNQIHIAHNVKIGENCIIAGQVGFAGSSTLGNNVMIGGQAGISGHLKIGNNVQIGGGSGVIKNIPDNSKVMGYPAKDIKNFIREKNDR